MMSFYFIHGQDRQARDVPRGVLILFAVTLALHIGWKVLRPLPAPGTEVLPSPPSMETLRLFCMGDHIAMARLLMLWLQAFDTRPGISIPYRHLDYHTFMAWLDTVLVLDPRGQYPLFAASVLYSEVPDSARQRMMLDFVYRKFMDDPEQRWPALAHAVYMAKHRLHDLPLALRYAKALTDHVTAQGVPHWVRQMQVWVLEDMGELEDARILLGGLLASGTITDPHELVFLRQRLHHLEQLSGNRQ